MFIECLAALNYCIMILIDDTLAFQSSHPAHNSDEKTTELLHSYSSNFDANNLEVMMGKSMLFNSICVVEPQITNSASNECRAGKYVLTPDCMVDPNYIQPLGALGISPKIRNNKCDKKYKSAFCLSRQKSLFSMKKRKSSKEKENIQDFKVFDSSNSKKYACKRAKTDHSKCSIISSIANCEKRKGNSESVEGKFTQLPIYKSCIFSFFEYS